MLLRGSNTRGARGQSQNRARSSRGRGPTSRGASISSNRGSDYRRKISKPRHKNKFSNFTVADTGIDENASNAFEKERLENAAKREQRGGQNRGLSSGGRANALGLHSNNQLRQTDNQAADKKEYSFSRPPAATASPFGAPSATPFNPFAPAGPKEASANGFGGPPVAHNPFGAPSQPSTSIFGKPQSSLPTISATYGLQHSPSTAFGAPSKPSSSNPFSGAPSSTNGTKGSSKGSSPFSGHPAPAPFGGSFTGSFSNSPASSSRSTPSQMAKSRSPAPPTFGSFGSTAMSNGSVSNSNAFTKPAAAPPSNTGPKSSSPLAQKMDKLLRKEGITPPTWPSTPGDPKQKGAIESFWQTSKAYRVKVRASLIRAGLLDDPDKPKKLSEAIDFKGTCEDMCPEFEKITRIMEHDVLGPEKEVAPDGTLWPSPPKMVKALARSAAGQDAPLPMDVRSPAALRRTLDYLIHSILGDNGNLPSVHGFLWDRTRAIRRDFVFQSSMNSSELGDQVYCLERITRFHVIALHQMSNDDVVAEDFSEQQEVEQLGKALLSLIHAYEDCNAQGIDCENEAEFRAYYVLFNSHNTGILETVQDWGWKFWGESNEIKIAVSLVETLQNTWDTLGPLRPQSTAKIAQNAYSRFFSIVEDEQVSYTMACFAEIHFNNVRKSALKTIFASYRKQRDQTKDWTLEKLNTYLWFDDDEDIISFGEAYGLQFEEIGDEVYLSFESGDAISDPFPPLKQRHSYALVEKKRGNNSLPAVIDRTVYEERGSAQQVDFGRDDGDTNEQGEEELELFVKDNRPENGSSAGVFGLKSTPVNEEPTKQVAPRIQDTNPTQEQEAPPRPTSTSLFDRIAAPPKQFGGDFFTKKVTETPSFSFSQPSAVEPVASAFSPAAKSLISAPAPTTASSNDAASTASTSPFAFLSQTPLPSSAEAPTKAFSFSSQTPLPPPVETPKTSFSLGSYPVSASSAPAAKPLPQFSFGNHAVAGQNEGPAITVPPPSQAAFGVLANNKDVSPPKETDQLLYRGFPSSAAPSTTPQLPSSAAQIPPKTPKLASAQLPASPFPSRDNKMIHTPSLLGQTPAASVDQRGKFSNFCNWFATGENGLVDQFTAFSVEQIVRNTMKMFKKTEAERIAREADELARKEADEFRTRSLAIKYGRMWREAAHRKWLKRRGREARKARQEMAESLRASKAAQSANIVEDFRASTNRRRNSLESLLHATGVLTGVHDSAEQIRAIVQDEIKKAGRDLMRRKSERSTNSPSSSTSKHKRSRTDNPLRRSLMSDPSYLNGGSRIHLLSRYSTEDEERRQVSGVQTDYFRLKARGISTLPNGTPLASSAVHANLRRKHSLDHSRTATSELSIQPTIPRSVPANNKYREGPRGSAERDDDIQALKARAKAAMADEESSRQRERKRSFDEDDDEELFARAKRIREQMDEGAQWFRSEIDKSRSVS